MNTVQNKSLGVSYVGRSSGKRQFIDRFKIVLCIVLLILASGNTKILGQGVGISELAPLVPHASSILELQSTTKGFLAPRMTTAQRTALGSIAANGLLVYDTDTKSFWYYDITVPGWKAVAATGLGTSNQLLGMNAAGDANEYKTLQGTTNRISVTFTPGAPSLITLSAPQDIATTSSPTFAGLTLTSPLTVPNGGTGLTSGISGGIPYFNTTTSMASSALLSANGVVIGGGAGIAPLTIAVGAANTVLRGTGGTPSFGQIVNGDITNGTINLTTKVTGILPLANGGTNTDLSGGTAIGDILYANNLTTFARLADIATGNVLLSGGIGVAPFWGKVGLTTHVSGILPILNGGTNSGTALSGSSIMVSDGSSIIQGQKGTTTTVLHGNGSGLPSYSAVDLTQDVSGVLPIPNGGTGSNIQNWVDLTTNQTVNGIKTWNNQGIFNSGITASGGVINLNNNSAFATNINTGTSGGNVTIGNTLSSLYLPKFTTPGILHNDGTGLISSGPISLTTDLSGILPVPNGGTGVATLNNHGVIIGQGINPVNVTAAGTAGQVLQSGGAVADPAYSTAIYPSTTTVNQILYSSSNDNITGLATAINGILVTNGTGVPSISPTLPNAVQDNITRLGTITSGTWNGTIIDLIHGGTNTDLSGGAAIGDILYANTPTNFARLADIATGNVLLSGGPGVAPLWGKVGLTTHVSGVLPIANGGTNSSATLNNNRLMISSSGSIIEAPAMVNGQVIVGSTGLAPQVVTMGGEATINNTGILSLATTGVTPNTYGDATHVGTFIVDNKGRLTSAANILITGTSPVGSSLTDSHIWVGNSSNIAAEVLMSGDATLTNTGIITISNNAITTLKIANDAVTTAKILDANVTVAKLGTSGVTDASKVYSTDGAGVPILIPISTFATSNLLDDHIFIGDASNTAVGRVMSGDATITNTGILTISNDAVTTPKIANDAVTSAKILDSNVTASKLTAGGGVAGRVGVADALGAITYGSLPAGSVTGNNLTSTDLTVTGGTGATLTAVTLDIANNAITNAKMADNAIGNAEMLDNAIGTVEIQNNAVTTAKILDANVTTNKLVDNAVTTIKISDANVTASKLTAGAGVAGRVGIADALGAITYGNIPAGSITGNNLTSTDLTVTGGIGATLTAASLAIAANAVTTGKILDGTILNADIDATAGIVDTKLATISTAGKVSNSATTATDVNTASTIVLRNATGNFSAGTITASLSGNATTATNLAGGSIGLIPYQSAANTTSLLAVGSAGQVLQSNGAAAPSWVTPNAGTVTTVSVISANGLAGSVATAGTTPAITLSTSVTGMLKGNGTAISAATGGTDFMVPNGAIIAGTNTKITYDIKGLVTSGAAAVLASADYANQGAATTNVLHGNGAGNPSWSQIVNADIGAAAGIVDTKLATISTAAKVSNSATTATDVNTASTIVLRNASGNFSAGTITASLSGNATTATSAITATSATNATTATNLAGGGAGSIPFQSAINTTSMLPAGTAGQILAMNAGGTAPQWSTLTGWAISGNAGTNPATNFLGTTDATDIVLRANNIERMRIENATGNFKIGDATSGTIKATKELIFREDGDEYGTALLHILNRTGFNGAMFETIPTGGANLVDFIFKTAGPVSRNLRFEARTGGISRTGSPSFHLAGADPDLPTLSLGDTYSAFAKPLYIGNMTLASNPIGTQYPTPTALLHLAAGTATAGTAPLKFTSGTNLTTAEDGAVEYDGTNYSVSVGTTRYILAKTLTATQALNFGFAIAQSSLDLTIPVTGAAIGDAVILGIPNASATTAGSTFTAWVSAANTVTVRFNNYSTNPIDPANGTFRVSVLKY